MADTIPAMLEPGEYVLNRNAVKAVGKNKLDELNYEEAPREGYQYGGSILGSLLSRTQKKDEGPVYPKPDYGEMMLPHEEALNMITQGGAAPVVAGMARQISKGGIRHLRDINTDDIKKALALLEKTGKGGKKIAKDVQIDMLLKKMFKEAPEYTPTKPRVKKQRGGSIDDYSLMDYMMPAMDKRLGPSLKKFQFGGLATDYQGNVVGPQTTGSGGYTGQSQYQYGATPPVPGTQSTGTGALPTSPTGFGGGLTGAAESTLGTALAEASVYTPPPTTQSGGFSTDIGSIFQEAGYETPGADYLDVLQAYDPTKQQRLQQDYGRKLPGPVGGAGGFASSGAAVRESGEQREMVTEQYQRGSEDLRKQYREDIMAQIAEDVASGTYEFDELGG